MKKHGFRALYTTLLLSVIAMLSLSLKSDKWEPRNFHWVSTELARSGQPDREEMAALEEHGIKTIVNLRYRISDKWELKKTGLKEVRIPLRAKALTFEEMVVVLRQIRLAEKPLLVHCLHGSDRTGCVIACCRMVFENWKKEDAITEFLEEKYGYNRTLFPNILELLQTIDVDQLREQVNQ